MKKDELNWVKGKRYLQYEELEYNPNFYGNDTYTLYILTVNGIKTLNLILFNNKTNEIENVKFTEFEYIIFQYEWELDRYIISDLYEIPYDYDYKLLGEDIIKNKME